MLWSTGRIGGLGVCMDDWQKKDWLERQADYRSKFSGWDDAKITLGFIVLPLVIVAGLVMLVGGLFGWFS